MVSAKQIAGHKSRIECLIQCSPKQYGFVLVFFSGGGGFTPKIPRKLGPPYPPISGCSSEFFVILNIFFMLGLLDPSWNTLIIVSSALGILKFAPINLGLI